MENEIFIILFDPVVVLLREPILITRSVEQMFYLRIQLSIIDFDKLDGIGMETKEAAGACRVVKNLLIGCTFRQRKRCVGSSANGVRTGDGY